MIPKVNLGVGEIGFMFCDLLVSLKKPSQGIYIFDKCSLFDFCFASRHIRFSDFYFIKSTCFDFNDYHVGM